ncbi:WhiB family transcriptional regulator [Streptomyces solincola]|uniref:WhiB family transcriptional regulator n=2 Tax=Streptomyces solincola TaxID=2100817 RepID=A0A2S9Q1M9_9ACTN|nr:WhiB family transcriptional regulator [Streptomyces solincola]
MIPAFMTESPCSRIDPEAMFPAPSDTAAITFAKEQVCGTCHFRAQCLEWAISPFSRSEYGIFGGHTEEERRDLVKARKLAKPVRLNYGPLPPKHQRLSAAA